MAVQNPNNNILCVDRITDQIVNNSVVLVNDNTLTKQVVRNTRYLIELELIVTSVDVASGFQWQITAPTASIINGCTLTNTTAIDLITSDFTVADVPCPVLFNSGLLYAGTGKVSFKGVLTTDTTDGFVTVQFAQAVAKVNDTTVCRGSFLKLTER